MRMDDEKRELPDCDKCKHYITTDMFTGYDTIRKIKGCETDGWKCNYEPKEAGTVMYKWIQGEMYE